MDFDINVILNVIMDFDINIVIMFLYFDIDIVIMDFDINVILNVISWN